MLCALNIVKNCIVKKIKDKIVSWRRFSGLHALAVFPLSHDHKYVVILNQ